MSATFDAAGFVADLQAVGFRVTLVRDVPRGGERAGVPAYLVRAPEGRALGDAYAAVMERWRTRIADHPDHVGAVVARLAELGA